MLVSGAPGVGKTALADELRPMATGLDGWFVAGKFDQYRRDLESDGVYQAFRALGRLLLAEPEEDLARVRERILRTLGPNAGLTAAAVRSLTYRSRFAEAIALGIESLGELGITVPAVDLLPRELDHQFGHLYRWLDHDDTARELARPDITDPALLATTGLINAILPACHVTGHAALAWLSLEALRIWTEHGPAATLVGPVSHTSFAAVTLRGDYAAGYRAMRRILAVGEARGYEPGTSQARFLFASYSCWFEPIENGVHALQQARDGLIAGGDLANAGYSYHPNMRYLLDCAPSLDVFVAEAEAGLAFARRTGSEQTDQTFAPYRWLAGVLRGECSAAAEPVPADQYAANPMALFHAHLTRAIAAAIFGDMAGLAEHTAAVMPLLPANVGTYSAARHRVRVTGAELGNRYRAAELTTSRARIVAAADQTRRRIERNLHDGAQQRLVTLALRLRQAQASAPPGADDLVRGLEDAITEVAGALEDLRETARGLHPAILTEGGLRPALRVLARRSAAPVNLDILVGRLSEPVEVAAYYSVAEALTNTAKYARASAVAVEVAVRDGVLQVCVRDDGQGGADFARGSGLVGLKDRVEALGGRIWLRSPPGAGTSLRAELPLK